MPVMVETMEPISSDFAPSSPIVEATTLDDSLTDVIAVDARLAASAPSFAVSRAAVAKPRASSSICTWRSAPPATSPTARPDSMEEADICCAAAARVRDESLSVPSVSRRVPRIAL
jgi:hypothetical protein